MATTLTDRLKLAKQTAGDSDWEVDLNAGFDSADDRLFQTDAGDPVTQVVTPHFTGQYYFDSTADTLWIATGALATDWKRVGGVIVDTEVNIKALDETEYANALGYASDTGTPWVVVSGTWTDIGRPTTPERYDSATSSYEQLLTDSWATLTTNGAAAMEAAVVIPATPTYAVWNIEAEGFVNLFDDGNDRKSAARLVQDIDAVKSYPASGATASNEQVQILMRTRVEGATLDKTYTYSIQVGNLNSGGGSYANFESPGVGRGPDGDIYPTSHVWVRAWRVDR